MARCAMLLLAVCSILIQAFFSAGVAESAFLSPSSGKQFGPFRELQRGETRVPPPTGLT